MNFNYLDIAKMIDHSLLNPTLTAADLDGPGTCSMIAARD